MMFREFCEGFVSVLPNGRGADGLHFAWIFGATLALVGVAVPRASWG
jgi:hypothetical protein